jgi:hypothetical protein
MKHFLGGFRAVLGISAWRAGDADFATCHTGNSFNHLLI